MELLLNLAWVLLALPGYWLWRQGAEARAARRVSPLQFLLALGCGLVLLFPVISVTDDLHAMQAETEESPAGKSAVRQAGGEKHFTWVNRWQEPPALAASAVQQSTPEFGRFEVSITHIAMLARPCVWRVGRAPPSSPLG